MVSTIENKYVIFKLGLEYYGIPIKNVLSIEKINKITRIPNSPRYVLGLINLRGDVVPVIDLNLKLGFNGCEIDENKRIIIIREDEIVVGLMVDSSSEVLEISQEDIDKPPGSETNELLGYVEGIGKASGRMIILLSVQRLLEQWGDSHGSK